MCLLYVRLQAALPPELVLQQVCVMGGGEEVVAEWLAHVLVEVLVLHVEDGALLRAQVQLEAVQRHGALAPGCSHREDVQREWTTFYVQ